MKKLVCFLALLATPALAQEQRTFAHNYDLNATAYTYCVTVKGRMQAGQNIKTSGSSTTVTAVATASVPFASLGVGDDLHVEVDGTEQRRRITAKASGSSVTIDSAANWENSGAGRPFGFSDITCGTTTSDGWVNTSSLSDKEVTFVMVTETSTGGVDLSIECRQSGEATTPIQILAANQTGATAPTNGEVIPVPESCASIRVGMKWGTADGGVDSVSAYITGYRRAN